MRLPKSKFYVMIAVSSTVIFCLVTVWPAFLVRTDLALTGDDASYVAHAFTLGLDFDLDYSNEVNAGDEYFRVAGRSIPSHPVGPGLVSAPVVALFSLLDRVAGHPVVFDRLSYQYSWSFFAVLLVSSLCLAIGMFLYIAALRPQFGSSVMFYVPAFVIASGLVFYAHGRFSMAHAHEFFAISLVFYFSYRLQSAVKALKSNKCINTHVIMLGISLALALSMRYANIHIVLLPILSLSLFGYADRKNFRKFFFSASVAMLVGLSLFSMLSFGLYGQIFPSFSGTYSNSPKAELFESASIITRTVLLLPNLVPLLLSSEFGLIWSNPGLFLGVVGLGIRLGPEFRHIKKRPYLIAEVLLFFAFLALPVAIVLNWQTTASSYGYRYLYSLMPIALWGSLYVIAKIKLIPESSKTKAVRLILLAFIHCLLILGTLSYLFFLSNPELTPHRQLNVFGISHAYSANHYLPALIRAMSDFGTWIVVAGRSLGVFIVLGILSLGGVLDKLPGNLASARLLDYYKGHHTALYVQLMVLIACWALIGLVYLRYWRKSEINHTNSLL